MVFPYTPFRSMTVASLVMAVTLGLYFRTVRGRWAALKSAQGQPKK